MLRDRGEELIDGLLSPLCIRHTEDNHTVREDSLHPVRDRLLSRRGCRHPRTFVSSYTSLIASSTVLPRKVRAARSMLGVNEASTIMDSKYRIFAIVSRVAWLSG